MLKLIKKDFNSTNTLIFIVFSVFFISSIQALSQGVSLFTIGTVKQVVIRNYIVFVMFFITLISISKFRRFSQWFLLCFNIMVVFKTFIFLAEGFNKLVLGLNFIYLLFSFYFFTNWELFVLKAANNPMYSDLDLEKNSRFNIRGHFEKSNGEMIATFLLTNIDEESCFVLLDSVEPNFQEKEVRIIINYENVQFTSMAEVVSSTKDGIGFSFLEPKKDLRSLSGLYKICRQRGLV